MHTRIIHAICVTLLGGAVAFAAAPARDGRAQTMSLIDADQKPAVENSLQELKSASAAQAATTNKAVVTLLGNQHSTAITRGFNVVQDEPVSAGGGGRGPTPTDYFMVALGTCQNVVFVRYAALEQLAIETRVSTTAPSGKMAEVARRTRRSCPIFATLRKETALTVRLIVNGQPVAL
jgi:uncharacterized OsmC-like protein